MQRYSVSFSGDQILLKLPNGKKITGVRKYNPLEWSLITTEGFSENGEKFGQLISEDIKRYYKLDNDLAGARFVVFNNGRCEYTKFGSGRPVIETIRGYI